MIAGHVDHFGTALGSSKDAPHHVAVALSPTQAILLHAPTIDDVAHQVQGVSGIVFEKIVEQLSLAVSSAQMYIRNEYGSIVHTRLFRSGLDLDILLVKCHETVTLVCLNIGVHSHITVQQIKGDYK